MSKRPNTSDSIQLFRDLALQGATVDALLPIARRWAKAQSSNLDPLEAAAIISAATLIREAFDTRGPAFAQRLVRVMENETKHAGEYVLLRKRMIQKSLTGNLPATSEG